MASTSETGGEGWGWDFIRSMRHRLNLDSFLYYFPAVPLGLGWLMERYWSIISGEIIFAVALTIAAPSLAYIVLSFIWFWVGADRLNLFVTPVVLTVVVGGDFLIYSTIMNFPESVIIKQALVVLIVAYLSIWVTQYVLWTLHKLIDSPMNVE